MNIILIESMIFLVFGLTFITLARRTGSHSYHFLGTIFVLSGVVVSIIRLFLILTYQLTIEENI